MKALLTSVVFIAFLGSVAQAEVHDLGDCSSKYNRPILVKNSYGATTPLLPNTRDGWCTPGLESNFFVGSGDATPTSTPSDNGCGYGGHGGHGGHSPR